MRRSVFVIGLILVSFIATVASAESGIGLKALGPRLSYVSPSDIDGTIGFGAIADLGAITETIDLQATADYWSKSSGSGDFKVDFRDIVLGARGKYVFQNTNPKLDPYAAAGLAIHLLKAEVPEQEIGGQTFGGSDSETKIGFDLAGGIQYASSENMDIIGEVMYRVVSDVGQFVIAAGLLFEFGN